MRRGDLLVGRRIRAEPVPDALGVEGADRLAQGAAPSGGAPELQREIPEGGLGLEISPGARDLVLEHRGHGEVLHEGHDVGEGLVEGEHVAVGRDPEAAVHPVEDGVRRLVGDDVVRQAGEHRAPRHVVARIVLRRAEVPEPQRHPLRIVVGVRLAERVRMHGQPLDVLAVVERLRRIHPRTPEHPPPQRALEMGDGGHRHRVHHLLVELRHALRGREAVLRQEHGIVQVNGGIERAVGVLIDDLEVLPGGTGIEILPRHLQDRLIDEGGRQPGREAGIDGIDPHATVRRLRDRDGLVRDGT